MTDRDTRAFLRGLAAAALSPALRSVICFDAAPDRLLGVASTFAPMLEAANSVDVRRINLGSDEREEGLWTALGWTEEDGALLPTAVAGWLAPSASGTLTLVVIPDLARLSLVAARAAVMLVDADVAHIERDGLSIAWRPTTVWLAGCATGDVGRVSPHLLDRFAVRLHLPQETPGERGTAIRRSLRDSHLPSAASLAITPSLFSSLKQDHSFAVRATPDALAEVLTLVDGVALAADGGAAGARREIALARLATSTAQLLGAREVTSAHVRAAAELIGIAGPEPSRPAAVVPPLDESPSAAVTDEWISETSVTEAVAEAARIDVKHPIMDPDTEVVFTPDRLEEPAPQLAAPYPEDSVPVDRELWPLRVPPAARGTKNTAGTPIGVHRASDLHDLALTATVLQAAKFQALRRRSEPDARGLLLSTADLRSYRRSPPPNGMLALVLDYTCGGDWTWTSVLRPYLQSAYATRASVCLVRVGASDAASELRAERVLARNLLDPRLGILLDVPAGRATPLAHGLELARQTLKHSLHHGRAGLLSAQLVVLTDGRGNIPLQASLAGRIDGATGRRGVDDALAVAAQLATLDCVSSTVIDPSPAMLADLPRTLARSLRAELDVSITAARQVTERAS